MTLTSLSKQNTMFIMTILSLLMVSLLSGCGIRGSLQVPPPVFGGETKVDSERVPTEDFESDEDDEDDLGDLDQDPLADL